ncbi:hypothetical protein H6G76_09690 [Nostoc sp. FACHB-152]|uniref:hypothetical protein n=1 Tax=unclassified Nostoc TaxID=2593658 RepID=UPI0016880254|nr:MULTISPECIES: hypothetical protein [unclassified Nostoc]MBD2447437.1 hypothetical protein [Nostoc sp. FACHB-152]MBD2468247.1 hypothetical protein [Nostoc sp. FACHB-145]
MVCSEILQKHQFDEKLNNFEHRLLVHPKGAQGSVYITQQEVRVAYVAALNFGHS